jgi:hypothetical protein
MRFASEKLAKKSIGNVHPHRFAVWLREQGDRLMLGILRLTCFDG